MTGLREDRRTSSKN